MRTSCLSGVVALFVLAAGVSGCGGGGGGEAGGIAPSAPPISQASPTTGVVPVSGGVVLGTESSAQVASFSTNAAGETKLTAVANSTTANALNVGTALLVPSGASSSVPLGVAGVTTERVANLDGSVTATIRPAVLAEVVDSISVGTAPIAIDSSTFIGVIAPRAVRPLSSGARSLALAPDRTALDGAIKCQVPAVYKPA